MCDNSRECKAAAASGFSASGRHRPLDEGPDASPSGSASGAVHPPRELIDKLGITAEMRVALLGVTDLALVAAVRSRAAWVSDDEPDAEADAIIYEVEQVTDLDRLARLRDALPPYGMLWVLWPKGGTSLRHAEVQRAGLDAGLVDVKVASVSERLSGLKFVFRLSDRNRPISA